jgi:hypothetical protein
MSDRKVSIHPLAVATVCDGYTSRVMGSTKKPANFPFFGLLFGKDDPKSSRTSIFDVCECDFDFDAASGRLIMNPDSLRKGMELALTVMNFKSEGQRDTSAEFRCVGWFVSGSEVNANHIAAHEDLMSIRFDDEYFSRYTQPDRRELCDRAGIMHNSPLMSDSLLFFLTPDKPEGEVPFEIHIFDNGVFSHCDTFELEASPLEQISMNAIMKAETNPTTLLIQSNKSFITSIGKLESNIEIVNKTLESYKSGEKPLNRDVLRQAAKICSLLERARDNSQNLDDLIIDTTMASLLSASTKANFDIKQLNDYYASSQSSKGMRYV